MPFFFTCLLPSGYSRLLFFVLTRKKDIYLTLISFLIIFFLSKVLISNPYLHRSICLFILIKNVFL